MGCENAGKYRLMPPGFFLLAIILMVVLHVLFPGRIVVTGWYRLLGTLPLVHGIASNLMADRAFKKVRTPVSPFAKTTTLITWGIFSRIRGMVCILSGIWLLLGSLSPILILVVFALLMHTLFIKPEESKLADEFGEAWIDYAIKTRRWL